MFAPVPHREPSSLTTREWLEPAAMLFTPDGRIWVGHFLVVVMAQAKLSEIVTTGAIK